MGRDKATLPFRGATLIEHVVSAVSQRCSPVFVVAAEGQAIPAPGVVVLRDRVKELGPLVAAGRGLRAAAESGAPWAFVCATDMPRLDAELIDLLTGAAARVEADVVIPWDGRDHFLAALYRTSLHTTVDRLLAAGERSMTALVNSVDSQRLVIPTSAALTNINTADELAALR